MSTIVCDVAAGGHTGAGRRWLRRHGAQITVSASERTGTGRGRGEIATGRCGSSASGGWPVTAESAADLSVLPDLLARIGGGDRRAFAEFYDLTSHRVYGMVVRVLRDPGYSEETTQEVYLLVWQSAASFDPAAGSAMSWLITLAHRRAVDRVRAETAAARRELGYGAAHHHSPFDAVAEAAVDREAGAAVRDCLDSLTDKQRESIDLAYYRGLTYREVAESLTAPLPTVKSRIRDGLARLAECLGVDHTGVNDG